MQHDRLGLNTPSDNRTLEMERRKERIVGSSVIEWTKAPQISTRFTVRLLPNIYNAVLVVVRLNLRNRNAKQIKRRTLIRTPPALVARKAGGQKPEGNQTKYDHEAE